jgi:hypothetical protein
MGLGGSDEEIAAAGRDLQAVLVSRDLFRGILPSRLMPDHEFVALVDPKTGRLMKKYDYGPSGPFLSPGSLVAADGSGSDTDRSDEAAFAHPTAWGVRTRPIPAPAGRVMAEGDRLSQQLGTPAAPGRQPYRFLPDVMGGMNSNSAAEMLVNRSLGARGATHPSLSPTGLAPGGDLTYATDGTVLRRTARGLVRRTW